MSRSSRLVSAVVMGALLGAGCSHSAPSPSQSPTPAPKAARSAAMGWLSQPPGKAAGEQVAQELVDAAVLPSGSQRLAKSPLHALDTAFSTVAADNLLDHPAWWKVNLSMKELLTFLRARPPKGLAADITGGGVSGFNQPTVDGLVFDPAHPLAGSPDLQFSVTSAGEHASWVRVDGQTIWYPARPAEETAPTQGSVTLAVTSGPTRTVTTPAVVLRLATEFNRLIRTTPEKRSGVNCSGKERTLSISFTKTGSTSPAIVAMSGGCSLGWGVSGPHGPLPGLDDGTDLVTDALALLGLPPTALSG